MTSPKSSLGDNGGRCEACDTDASRFQGQTAHRIKMATGRKAGEWEWGTTWLCPPCLSAAQAVTPPLTSTELAGRYKSGDD